MQMLCCLPSVHFDQGVYGSRNVKHKWRKFQDDFIRCLFIFSSPPSLLTVACCVFWSLVPVDTGKRGSVQVP